MTKDEARALLIKTLKEVSDVFDNGTLDGKIDNPQSDIRIEELEIDSLVTIEWAQTIELEVMVPVDPTELTQFYTLNELAAHLASKVK